MFGSFTEPFSCLCRCCTCTTELLGLSLHLQWFGFVILTFELVRFLQCSAMLFLVIYDVTLPNTPIVIVWTVLHSVFYVALECQ